MCRKNMFFEAFLTLVVVSLASVCQALPEPVGWWTLDDGAGTTAVDNTGNGYDATLGGDAAWVEGVRDGGVHFSGAGWIDLPVEVWNEKIVPNATYSFCFWYNLPDAGANKVGFGSTLVGGGRHFQSHLPWANGTIYFDTSGHRGNDQSWQADWTGEWAFWTFQHDPTNGWKRYYRNDELIHDSTGQAATLPEATALVVGANGGHATGSVATYDDIRFYDVSLTVEEIQGIMAGDDLVAGPAVGPSPSNGQTDVLRDTVLTWCPGKFSNGHDVYFGTSFDDVNTATPASDAYQGSQTLEDTGFDPGVMAFDATYFWRIDEVNDAHPDKLWKGDVWSFEVEPEGVMLDGDLLTVTASSQNSDTEDPNNTINGVGLNPDGSHSTDTDTMWRSDTSAAGEAWIQYDLSQPQKLLEILVWNHNSSLEADAGFGIKDALIEVSNDGIEFTSLGAVELAQATETVVDMQNTVAQFVRITAQSNWGGFFPKYGLSKVRFLVIPTVARELSPADGEMAVDPTTAVLTWRAGRDAAAHDVYMSTDLQAVIDGTAPVVTVHAANCMPDLELGMTYYWRVDEVNDVDDPAVWIGGVQNFSTAALIVVDDMESYKVDMWETWADGYEDPTNGALVGHGWEATPETKIVYEGSQSMPMTYGDAGIQNSWTTRAIDSPKDWSQYGIKSLSLFFHGSVDNVGGQLYVKINDTQFDYQGAATDIQTAQWYPWTIDLSGVTAVDTLTVGVLGGSGQLYVDNMRLYPLESELITPVVPDTADLQIEYLFEDNFNDTSGNGHHGTALGDAAIITDPSRGQVLSLDGTDDAVDVPLAHVAAEVTIAMWLKLADLANQNSAFMSHGWEPNAVHTRVTGGSVNMGVYGPGNLGGKSVAVVDEWIWVTYTVKHTAMESTRTLSLNGVEEAAATTAVDPEVGPLTVWIGNGAIGGWVHGGAPDRELTGFVDDVVIYDRALSAAEIAGLAGRTAPLYKRF
ncbi:LamG-like jellyroll fold domain-containing protein [Planctomycetota bacterium]